MVLPLPPAKTQFLDANGSPLAGGFVYNYVPATTTPKTTWSDSAGSTPNSNPVVLDSAGRAAIFGNGIYRQIVTDSLGNQIYDANTSIATLSTLGAVALAGDTMTGRLTVPGLTSTGGTAQTITPIGNPSLLSFNPVSMTTGSSSQNELGFSVNITSNKGAGASSAASLNKVAGYFGIQANTGSGNVWGINPIVVVSSGACANGGVQVAEFDLANNSGTNFGETAGAAGVVQPAAFGMQVTGISANRATAAIAVLGNLQDLVSPMWNRGLAFINNSISQVTIADYTQSATSVDLRGTHSGYGVDFQNGTFTSGAVRLGSQQKVVARKADNSADFQMLQASSSNNVVIGDSPGAPGSAANAYVLISSTTGLAPQNDNGQVCGQTGARWSAVWAANGTIQTSDPTLKTDIAPVTGRKTGAIVDAIHPITFRWIDGGNGQPGRRQHWGWNAEEIGAVFDGLGEDFGGYVKAEDGTRHLRPDQLLPILWAEVQALRARVAAIETR